MSPVTYDVSQMLGPCLREHKTRWTYLATTGILGVLLSAGAIAGAVRMILGLVRDESESVVGGAIAMMAFTLGGAISLWWTYRSAQKRVALHHGGVHYKNPKGEWLVPWSLIDGVYEKILRTYRGDIEIDVQDVYTIALRDGTMLEVDFHFSDVDAFGSALTDAVTVRLLPRYREALHAGYPVDFGTIGIDGRGVHAEGRSLPWHEVESIVWKQGFLSSDRAYLHIRRAGDLLAWAKLPVERIKNYQALMALVREMGKAG